MNILFLNKFNDQWKKQFARLKAEFPQVHFTATYNPDERKSALKTADAVISGRLSESEILSTENLKVIFVPFTGLNTFPLDIIKNKKILVSNTHANARFVAERAVTLALSMLGRVVEFHNDLKQGKWNRSIEDNEMWTTLQNKTCGIIGLGNIGMEIAKFLKCFNCKVIGFKKDILEKLPESIDEISTDLTYTIGKSDIIFVSLPLTPETKGIINSPLLMSMKEKYIVNIGRGETIDEDGLYNSLKDGILKGAALDVWYNYPGKKTEPVFPSNKPFWELPNVVISPHKSSHTTEAINSMINDTAENIRTYILTGTPANLVSL